MIKKISLFKACSTYEELDKIPNTKAGMNKERKGTLGWVLGHKASERVCLDEKAY